MIKRFWHSLSAQTRKYIGVRVMYVALGMLFAYFLFVEKQETVIIQHQRDAYRDTLAVDRYKLELLTQYLIQDAQQDHKDSLALRSANLDSLLSYIAARQVL